MILSFSLSSDNAFYLYKLARKYLEQFTQTWVYDRNCYPQSSRSVTQHINKKCYVSCAMSSFDESFYLYKIYQKPLLHFHLSREHNFYRNYYLQAYRDRTLNYKQELCFLRSARHLIMLYICRTFPWNIMICFNHKAGMFLWWIDRWTKM